MGHTHHNKVAGVNGVFTGATGSETRVANAGIIYAGTGTANIKVAEAGVLYKGTAGSEIAISNKEVVMSVILAQSSTATQSFYIVAPVAGNLVAASSFIVNNLAAATTGVVSVSHGTAGANLVTTVAGAATIGTIQTFTASADVTVTAGELLKLTITAAATSIQQTALGVVLTFDKT